MDNYHEYFLAFTALTILYAALMAFWIVNWFKHRNNSGIGLHKYIGFALAFECIAMLTLAMFYPVKWNEPDHYAAHPHSYYISVTFEVLLAAATTVFYSMLIIISMGWCIIENTLTSNEILGLAVFILAYFIVDVLRISETSDTSNTFISLLYLELVLFIGMLIYVSMKTNYNIRKLSLLIKPDEGLHTDPSSSTSHELSETPSTSSKVPPSPPGEAYSIGGDEEEEEEEEEKRRQKQRKGKDTAGEAEETQTAVDGGESGAQSATTSIQIETLTIPEAREKLKLFNYFYKLITIYIICSAVFKYFDTYAVAVIIGMYWNLVFFCGICHVFRLRDTNQYFYLVNQE